MNYSSQRQVGRDLNQHTASEASRFTGCERSERPAFWILKFSRSGARNAAQSREDTRR